MMIITKAGQSHVPKGDEPKRATAFLQNGDHLLPRIIALDAIFFRFSYDLMLFYLCLIHYHIHFVSHYLVTAPFSISSFH